MWFDITAAQTETVWLAPIARSNRDALVNRMTDDEVSKGSSRWRRTGSRGTRSDGPVVFYASGAGALANRCFQN